MIKIHAHCVPETGREELLYSKTSIHTLQQTHVVLFWNATSVMWVPVPAKARAIASSYVPVDKPPRSKCSQMRHYGTLIRTVALTVKLKKKIAKLKLLQNVLINFL